MSVSQDLAAATTTLARLVIAGCDGDKASRGGRPTHQERDEKALVPERNGSLLRARGFFITLLEKACVHQDDLVLGDLFMAQWVRGLGPGALVPPHFDEFLAWPTNPLYALRPRGAFLLGIEGDTALIGRGEAWVVRGWGVWMCDGMVWSAASRKGRQCLSGQDLGSHWRVCNRRVALTSIHTTWRGWLPAQNDPSVRRQAGGMFPPDGSTQSVNAVCVTALAAYSRNRIVQRKGASPNREEHPVPEAVLRAPIGRLSRGG